MGTVLAMQAQLTREIIFSDRPLNPESPQNLKKDFISGEHIYTVTYLPNAVKNLYQNQSPIVQLQLEVFIYEKNRRSAVINSRAKNNSLLAICGFRVLYCTVII